MVAAQNGSGIVTRFKPANVWSSLTPIPNTDADHRVKLLSGKNSHIALTWVAGGDLVANLSNGSSWLPQELIGPAPFVLDLFHPFAIDGLVTCDGTAYVLWGVLETNPPLFSIRVAQRQNDGSWVTEILDSFTPAFITEGPIYVSLTANARGDLKADWTVSERGSTLFTAQKKKNMDWTDPQEILILDPSDQFAGIQNQFINPCKTSSTWLQGNLQNALLQTTKTNF